MRNRTAHCNELSTTESPQEVLDQRHFDQITQLPNYAITLSLYPEFPRHRFPVERGLNHDRAAIQHIVSQGD